MDPNESKTTPYYSPQKTIPSLLLPSISPMSHFSDLSPFFTYTTINTNEVFDETAAARQRLSHERRLKRLKSNREAAQRSRMRRRKRIQDLEHGVEQLKVDKNRLYEKLIGLLEVNKRILEDNAQLKENVAFLEAVLNM